MGDADRWQLPLRPKKDAIRPIKEAVHSNLAESRAVYDWVVKLCIGLSADAADMVPFEKYANAALSLGSPSSAARALAAGAANIERVDRLVQSIAAQKGLPLPDVDDTVALVDGWLAKNRPKPVASRSFEHRSAATFSRPRSPVACRSRAGSPRLKSYGPRGASRERHSPRRSATPHSSGSRNRRRPASTS